VGSTASIKGARKKGRKKTGRGKGNEAQDEEGIAP